MKKIYVMFAAAAALSAVSCVKDEVYDGEVPEVVVKQTLVINEVCPQSKQLEFYNYGTEEIDLGGCYMIKDGTDQWNMPSVKLAAGKVIVFTAKSADAAEGPSFGLSATKGFLLELFNSKGESIDKLDNSKGAENFFAFTESDDESMVQSLGRKTDGDSKWVIFMPGSIGKSNSQGTYLQDWGAAAPTPTAGVEALKLNELNGNDKFIEIVNPEKSAISIKGIKILKDTKDVWTAPDIQIPAGGFLLLYSQDVVAAGQAHEGYDATLVFTSGLSAKKAVHVQLVKEDGTTSIDDFNFAKHPGTAIAGSYGRNADGNWYIQPTATPGAANVDGTEPITLGE